MGIFDDDSGFLQGGTTNTFDVFGGRRGNNGNSQYNGQFGMNMFNQNESFGGANPLGNNTITGGIASGIGEAAPGIASALKGFAGKAVPYMGALEGGLMIAQGLSGRRKRKKEQKEAAQEYKDMRSAYKNLDTSNLAANYENQITENVYEDATVNTQQAEFMANQQAQSQANIMQGLSGAAGGSGIAGLAQALANQNTQASAKASASIGMQESANQKLMGQGELMMMKGEQQAEQIRLQGAERSRGLEFRQTGIQLQMSQQRKIAADKARAEAAKNLVGGIGKVATSVLTGGVA
tara:strand:+ start:178 stop:1059 length:882 start_codon:yes stop_codon:yes gene_type:complete